MTIYYQAENRKPLVQAVSEFTGAAAVYLRTPTYAYQIGSFTVTREGNLDFDDQADSRAVEALIAFLAEKGFVSEDAPTEAESTGNEELSAEQENAPREESVGLTVAMPREGFTDTALENLRKLVEAKGSLIKKALALEELPIEVTDETVSFPWFSDVDGDTATAYTHFIAALCDMAKNQKRISAKEKDTENEKYAFRCFLLRLGFIGEEYKADRKILLQNLSGNSAFKNTDRMGVA